MNTKIGVYPARVDFRILALKRIQSSHLIFTFSTDLHSSVLTFRNLGKMLSKIAKSSQNQLWGSIQPELILGSSPLKIQSSHLIFTLSADLHSSALKCRNSEKCFQKLKNHPKSNQISSLFNCQDKEQSNQFIKSQKYVGRFLIC